MSALFKTIVFPIPFGCVTKLLISYNGQHILHRNLKIEHLMSSMKYNTKLFIVRFQIIASSGRDQLGFPIN